MISSQVRSKPCLVEGIGLGVVDPNQGLPQGVGIVSIAFLVEVGSYSKYTSFLFIENRHPSDIRMEKNHVVSEMLSWFFINNLTKSDVPSDQLCCYAGYKSLSLGFLSD